MTEQVSHPFALWLRRVAENLDTIFVRYRDEDSERWESRALSDVPIEAAASHVADFLGRWPFIPVRVKRALPEASDAPLTVEELKAALHGKRALALHFAEIRERVLRATSLRRSEAQATVEGAREYDQLLVDATALVGYLQLALDENERLVAFLLGLEEAGTISREELQFLMGLRRA
jgi:hypothetical protein